MDGNESFVADSNGGLLNETKHISCSCQLT